MPTTMEEAKEMKTIVLKYVPQELATKVFDELFDVVGLKTENGSVKTTLFMLRQLFRPEPPMPTPVEPVDILCR